MINRLNFTKTSVNKTIGHLKNNDMECGLHYTNDNVDNNKTTNLKILAQ